MPGGFVGVDIFFVISGYLIGGMVFREMRLGTFSFAGFYARRARRILPALICTILAVCALGFLLLTPNELRGLSASAFSAITSNSNFFFFRRASDYFDTESTLHPLLMTWTLGIEEQFYLFFPPLLYLMRRWPARNQLAAFAAMATLSLTAWIALSGNHPAFTFYMLLTRGWELGAGILLALIEERRGALLLNLPRAASNAFGLLGLALLIFPCVFPVPIGRFSILNAVVPAAGTLLVLIAGNGLVNRSLAYAPMVFIGKISYSWYLWHWPLLSFASICTVSGSGLSTSAAVLVATVSLACALLSYWFIETPFRNSHTPARPLLARYGLLVVSLCSACLLIFLFDGLPQRNPQAHLLDTTIAELQHDPCLASEEADRFATNNTCIPTGTAPAIALIGDSHAASLAPALRAIGAAQGYRLIQLTKALCPPLAFDDATPASSLSPSKECSAFNQNVDEYIQSNHSIQVVIASAWWQSILSPPSAAITISPVPDSLPPSPNRSPELLQQNLIALAHSLTQNGKTFYLVQDYPEFSFDPARLLKLRAIPLRAAIAAHLDPSSPIQSGDDQAPEPRTTNSESARQALQLAVAAVPGIHILDLQQALCSAGLCRFALNGQTLYRDYEHLTTLGGAYALRDFRLP